MRSPSFLGPLSLLCLSLLPLVAACDAELGRTCTALGIIRDLKFDARLPDDIATEAVTIEICFGDACDTSRLVQGTDETIRCEDLDGRTPRFPTQCVLTPGDRKLAFTTNTVYGGHAGSDPLTVTAVASGGRREILRGTVRYTDTTDDAARGACVEAWTGTFERTDGA